MRHWSIGLLLIGLSTVTSAQSPVAMKVPPSYFGINGTKYYHVPEQENTVVAQRMAWMRELGVRWDRTDLWWHTVEPFRGSFTFSRPDQVLAGFERNGIQWYPILCYGSAWWEQGRNSPKTDQDFADFGRYAERIVGRYRGRVPVWSFWNEPNILPFWAPAPRVDDYARLLKQTAPLIRAADRSAKIAAPVVAPIGPWDRGFVQRFLRQGTGPFFDIFDYHYYRSGPPEDEVPAELAEIRAVMVRDGGGEKPIWISESGVTSIGNAPQRQAAYVVRHHLVSLGEGVEKFFYFDLQNWEDNNQTQWDSQLGLVMASGAKKPSFDAYRTMVQMVDRPRRIVRRLAPAADRVERVLVHDARTDRWRLAIWSAGATVYGYSVRLAGPVATRVSLYGVKSEVRADAAGTIRLDLGEAPIYIDGVDPAEYLPRATRLGPAMTLLSPGESARLNVILDPGMVGATWKWADRNVDSRLAYDPGTGRISLARTARPVDVTVLRPVVSGTIDVTWRGRTVRVPVRAAVDPLAAADLRIMPVRGTEGGLELEIEIGDESGQPRTAPLNLDLGSGYRSVRNVQVPAYGRKVVRVPLPDARPGGSPWRATFAGVTSPPVRTYALQTRETPPEIDGTLTEWKGVPAVPVGDAMAQALITRIGLFFAATVRDQNPAINPYGPGFLWRADGFEVYLGVGGPSTRTILDKAQDFQLGFTPTSDTGKPAAFWFHKDVIPPGSQVASLATDKGWTLEGMIPWADLGINPDQLNPGDWVGFDVKLNDRDPDEKRPMTDGARFSVWNGGGMNWINPSLWGLAQIVTETPDGAK